MTEGRSIVKDLEWESPEPGGARPPPSQSGRRSISGCLIAILVLCLGVTGLQGIPGVRGGRGNIGPRPLLLDKEAARGYIQCSL